MARWGGAKTVAEGVNKVRGIAKTAHLSKVSDRNA